VPLYLQYGDTIDDFLAGAREVDQDFLVKANPEGARSNMALMLGLLGWWNTEHLKYSARAVLPYSQALVRFASHVQQLDMESNGKQCTSSGAAVATSGPIVFGEPGTNGQHSFYQLLHQGRTVPAEFIGFCKSHSPDTEAHEELMCNFFAQPDALALGRTTAQLQAEGCPEALLPHKTFSGDRPSLSLLFPELSGRAVGQLLALYEHRVAVEGFLWGVNSFDQYGVELGKVLATGVKKVLSSKEVAGQVSEVLLSHYLAHRLN
jgi:glucose-6-phosphate isomerase